MRPRIIEFFNSYFHVHFFNYIIPDPAFVYAIMLGLGIIIFVTRCNKDLLNMHFATGIALWASIAAIIGGRIFFLLQNLGYTVTHPAILTEINGATVSFGVYIGGMLGVTAYSTINRISMPKYLDVIASVLGIGPMIGRLACFLNGDDYGKISNVPWAVKFPHGSYPFLDQVNKGLISPMANLSLPVHPVQLYGSVKGIFLFVLFSFLWRKKYFKPGVLFLLFWITYSVCRFNLEFFRGDDDRGWIGPFSTGQFFSMLIGAASIAGIFIFFKGKIRRNELQR